MVYLVVELQLSTIFCFIFIPTIESESPKAPILQLGFVLPFKLHHLLLWSIHTAQSSSMTLGSLVVRGIFKGISLLRSNITIWICAAYKGVLPLHRLLGKSTSNKWFWNQYSAGFLIFHTRGHCWFSKTLTAVLSGNSIILECPLESVGCFLASSYINSPPRWMSFKLSRC